MEPFDIGGPGGKGEVAMQHAGEKGVHVMSEYRQEMIKNYFGPQSEKQHVTLLEDDFKTLAWYEDAGRVASEEVISTMEYLELVGDRGVAQLNRLLKTKRQTLGDFEKPAPLDQFVYQALAMPAKKAHSAFQYRILYKIQQVPHALRMQLRPIQFALDKIQPADLPTSVLPALEHRSRMVAYCMGAGPALRVIYDDLLIFADAIATHVKTIKDTKLKVPEHMFDTCRSSDGEGSIEFVRDLFD